MLLNTFWVYIIPSLLNAWTVILMKTYFSNLPESIEESAKVDGANDLTIFFKIIVPMSMPLIATMLLFAAVGHWNDWVSGEMFVMDPKLLPVQTILMRMITQVNASAMIQQSMSMEFVAKSPAIESIKMAAIVVTTVPIILVYPFLQKYFVQGVMIGSVKG
jgi:putative aldouronate transport system permease protein